MFIATDCHKYNFERLDATLHVSRLTTCIQDSATGSMAHKQPVIAGKTESHEGPKMPHA